MSTLFVWIYGMYILCVFLTLAPYAAEARSYRPVNLNLDVAPVNAAKQELNNRPLIGILTQVGAPAPDNHTYFAASYVKYVEAGGARAVPIQCDLPAIELAERFAAINGLLIPGGQQILLPGQCFYDAALQLLQLAISATDAGDYFPVHATCLGFEVLAIQMSKNTSLLSKFDATNLPSKLQPLPFARGGESRLWNALPSAVRRKLKNKPISMQNHAFGVSLTSFHDSEHLVDNFDLVATGRDRQGREYVTIVEGKRWPIYGFQSHPEKPAFEWTPLLDIPHDPDAVDATLAMARFFGNEARRSQHRAQSRAAEDDLVIYNWTPSYTGKDQESGIGESAFEQCYFFPMLENTQHELEATDPRSQLSNALPESIYARVQ